MSGSPFDFKAFPKTIFPPFFSAAIARAFDGDRAATNGRVPPPNPEPENWGERAVAELAAAIADWGERAADAAHAALETATEEAGKVAGAIADNPAAKLAAKIPGADRFLTFLGRADADRAQADVARLQLQYPDELPRQIAHRLSLETALKAGAVGVATNFIPPVALALFAVDVAATAQFQVNLAYRVAAAYGFSLADSTRRGEILALLGLALGGSGLLKLGLSAVELIPGIGLAIGATSNALTTYLVGYAACRFYEAKLARARRTEPAEPATAPSIPPEIS